MRVYLKEMYWMQHSVAFFTPLKVLWYRDIITMSESVCKLLNWNVMLIIPYTFISSVIDWIANCNLLILSFGGKCFGN